jgi:hypothetical protein
MLRAFLMHHSVVNRVGMAVPASQKAEPSALVVYPI